MNVISDPKLQSSTFTSFHWFIFRPSNLPWSKQTSKFCLQNQSIRECFLSMECSILDLLYNLYKVKLELRFISDIPKNERSITYNVILNFQGNDHDSTNHIFELTKDNQDEKLYTTSRNITTTWFFKRTILIIQVDIYQKQSCYLNNKLSRDLKCLLENENYSDLKLIVKDKTFQVHKSVLSCRSDILAKIIENNTVEKRENIIELHDIDPIVVRELLNYIYTDDCNLTKIAHDLFKIAHFLKISELQRRCKEFLFDNMSVSNIVQILELLDENKYELTYLKDVVGNFIALNEDVMIKDEHFLEYLRKSVKLGNMQGIIIELACKPRLEQIYMFTLDYIIRNTKENVQKEYIDSHFCCPQHKIP